MNKIRNRLGFSLAELLIVVAIIGVLVAIAIPVFSTQLERARDTVTINNLREAYSEAAYCYLRNGGSPDFIFEDQCTYFPRGTGLYEISPPGYNLNSVLYPIIGVRDVEFLGTRPGIEFETTLPFDIMGGMSEGVYDYDLPGVPGYYDVFFRIINDRPDYPNGKWTLVTYAPADDRHHTRPGKYRPGDSY